MGMNQFGEIGRLTEIAAPDMGLITNVAGVHLEGVGDIMGVARAKAELVQEISRDAPVILNGDDALLMEIASPLHQHIITYGTQPHNDIRAVDIQDFREKGVAFTLHTPDHSIPIRITIPGIHNVLNALAASAIALHMDEPPDTIKNRLRHFTGIKGRLTLFPLRRGITLVDDTYNANPVSLQAALSTIKGMAKGSRRLVVGLGDMKELGAETVPAHQEAGRTVAAIGAAYLVTMGEHAQETVSGALHSGLPSNRVIEVLSHEEMAQQIQDIAQANDVILLKGSRTMQLERVAESLKKALSEKD
jgi:UDP-N-acetylmuramoyl-tripeptide--D-alanyl-D-alanine ligase